MAISLGLKAKKKSFIISKRIKQSIDSGIIGKNIASVQSSLNSYRPVYKIAITYPIEEGTEIKAVTRIVADTTKGLSRFLGLPISDVIGMWIDSDDVASPDKAALLLRIDPTFTKDTITGQSHLTGKDIAFNRYFSNRNWIDIWIGYEQVGTGNIIPSKFEWFDETHVFSGPIVLVDRKLSKNGDQLTIIAFSAEQILKFAKLKRKPSESNNSLIISHFKKEDEIQISLAEGILDIIDHIMPNSIYRAIREGSSFKYAFVIGDFYWELIKDGIGLLQSLLEKKTSVDKLREIAFPPIDIFLNTDYVTGVFPMKTYLALNGNVNLWDTLQAIIEPESSAAYGLSFRILKRKNPKVSIPVHEGIMGESLSGLTAGFTTKAVGSSGSGSGSNVQNNKGHAGIHFQFFVPMDVEELVELYRLKYASTAMERLDRLISFKGDATDVQPIDYQSVIIGQDVIDMETYIDYSEVFNSFRVITKTDTSILDPSGDPVYASLEQQKSFPLDLDLSKAIYDKNNLKEYWESVLRDIQIFGEQEFPIPKFFSIPIAELEKIRKETSILDKKFLKLLAANVDINRIAGHDGIAGSFKRYMFGGLQGSAYCVGNPALKVGRLLIIKDVRSSASSSYKDDGSLLGSASSAIGDVIGRVSTDGIISKLHGQKKYEPIEIQNNFADAVNDNFHIWKVRHYYGPKSGFLTKVYFTKTRSRAWRSKTGDIAGIMRQAMRNAEQFFGS